MFVHPKTGSLGADNITDESKALLYKRVLECIQTNDLFYVTVNAETNTLVFTKKETD